MRKEQEVFFALLSHILNAYRINPQAIGWLITDALKRNIHYPYLICLLDLLYLKMKTESRCWMFRCCCAWAMAWFRFCLECHQLQFVRGWVFINIHGFCSGSLSNSFCYDFVCHLGNSQHFCFIQNTNAVPNNLSLGATWANRTIIGYFGQEIWSFSTKIRWSLCEGPHS